MAKPSLLELLARSYEQQNRYRRSDEQTTLTDYLAGLEGWPTTSPINFLAGGNLAAAGQYRSAPPPLLTPPPSNLHTAANLVSLSSPPRTYSLFLSHAWDYHEEYEGLVNLLNGASSFHWKNLSIPRDNPVAPNPLLQRSNRQLIREIDRRIQEADCVLIIAGMYCKHREWIQSEIEAAQEFGKSIIGVRPRGRERAPQEVSIAVGGEENLVNWYTESIVAAIRRRVL
jgi:hypothetical protein